MDASSDDRAARIARTLQRSREIAADFAGLTEDAAREKASEHPELQFQFVPEGGFVRGDLRPNRVRLWTRDGVVVSATAG